jgi:hypothetical protein
MAFAKFQAATHCTAGATPGARALMRWELDHHDMAYNLGIFSCRDIAGTHDFSCHAEGRADDVGVHLVNHKPNPVGYTIVRELRPHASHMGIQVIIFNKTIWSAKSSGFDGRPYPGSNPHLDHVHVELTRLGGAQLNLATIMRWARPHPILQSGDHGASVRTVQRLLGGGLTVDGVFGVRTQTAVNLLKAHHKWPTDGVIGPRVWEALERKEDAAA